MTQKKFDNYFKNEVLPIIAKQYEADGIPDRPARREAYNNEIDNSHRSGQITDQQASNWCISDNLETMELKKFDKEKRESDYFKLLHRYRKAINDIYDHDNSGSSDYTPDHMSYDFNGFEEDYNNSEYDYYKELKLAVNKAELYVKYLDHEYNGTFG